MAQTGMVYRGQDTLGLARSLATGAAIPVPAALAIGESVLFWVNDHKTFLRCQAVHPRAGRELLCALLAAVQHHQQRAWYALERTWWCEKVVAAYAGNPQVHGRTPLCL